MATRKVVRTPVPQRKFDASLLQFIPKGSYYNTEESQRQAIEGVWTDFLGYNRQLFALSMLLPGTDYSKARMSHLLLSNPVNGDVPAPIEDKAFGAFETEIIEHVLGEESQSRALKSLLLLQGRDLQKRVNNARTRKLILRYLYNRGNASLDTLAVTYKSKLAALTRHALGKQTLYGVLNGSGKPFWQTIGKINPDAYPVIMHLFGKYSDYISRGGKAEKFPKIKLYYELGKLAKEGKAQEFVALLEANKGVIPFETALGMRNTNRLDVEVKTLMDACKMGERQKLQAKAHARREGTDVEVDYKKQSLYDLYKLYIRNTVTGEDIDTKEIEAAIEYRQEHDRKIDLGLGKIVVVFDYSRSMEGSEKRAYHPVITGLCMLSQLQGIDCVIPTGGANVKTDFSEFYVPAGGTDLFQAFVSAVEKAPDTIIVFSDGYENTVKGAFAKVYEAMKVKHPDINVLHLNPVFSAEAGTGQRLAEDLDPMPLENYEFLFTNIVFKAITENPEKATQMLLSTYRKKVLQIEDGGTK